jgi:hypothetical protein
VTNIALLCLIASSDSSRAIAPASQDSPPPAQETPRLSTVEVAKKNLVRDEDVEAELYDTGVLRVMDRQTGATVYADPDEGQTEEVPTMFDALRTGDADDEARANLHPYENTKPDYEPMAVATLEGSFARLSPIGFSLTWDQSECLDFANAIAASRSAYLEERGTTRASVKEPFFLEPRPRRQFTSLVLARPSTASTAG